MRIIFTLLFVLFASVASAQTNHYVSVNGNDSNSCATASGDPSTFTESNAKRNFLGGSGALACLSAGETLYVYAGTYAEAITGLPSGSSGNVITIRAKDMANRPIIRPGSGGSDGFLISNDDWLTFIGLKIDMTGTSGNGVRIDTNSNDITWEDCEINNVASGSGTNQTMTVLTSGSSGVPDNITFRRCIIDRTVSVDTGSHCVYVNHTSDFLIEDSELLNCGGYGVHIYTCVNDGMGGCVIDPTFTMRPIVRNNEIHGAGRSCVLVADATDARIENNDCYDSFGCVRVASSDNHPSDSAMVAHNTCYGNSSEGLWVFSQSDDATIYNNILYQNASNGNNCENSGSGTIGVTSGADCTNSSGGNLIGTNPTFTNASAGEFTISSGSAAKDIGLSSGTTGVTTDLAGVLRSSPDAGAHEYVLLPYRVVLPTNWGSNTRGGAGHGTMLCRVTNLNNSGNGSLRAALEATNDCAPTGCDNDISCRRIVIFETSGTITLSSTITINDPYITIAGQTAPAPGIQVRDYGIVTNTHDVVFQHFRIRVGDVGTGNDEDAIGVDDGGMVLVDHMTLAWAPDEALGIFQNGDGNVMIWKSLMHESTECGTRDTGASPCSALGSLTGQENTNVAYIQNLFAHMNHRTPAGYGGSRGYIANNVIYNFKADVTTAMFFPDTDGSGPPFGCDVAQGSEWDIINNYFRGGPSNEATTYAMGQRYLDAGVDKLFISGNTRDPDSGDTITEYLILGSGDDCIFEDARVGSTTGQVPAGYTPLSAGTAYTTVLATVGAWPGNRDDHEDRIISEVTNRTGAIIDSQGDVGGWETYAVNTIDHDAGTHPLPSNPSFGDDNGDGYSNIEEWLENYACEVEGEDGCWGESLDDSRLRLR